MPDVGIQVPPNLSDWWVELVRGGRDRPRRPVGQRRPHLARAAVPEPAPGAQARCARGLRADRAALRLPAVHGPGVDGAGRARRRSSSSTGASSRGRGSGRRSERADRPGRSRRGRSRRAREGEALTEDELTALFAETPARGDRGDARWPPTSCAAELAGDAGDVRRQPQHQLHQHLRGRLRLLRLRPGQALARRLPRRRGGLRRAGAGGGRVRRDRDLHAGRDPSRLHARGLRALAAARQGGRAADPPARLLADGGPLHVRALGQGARGGLRVPARVRPRLDARAPRPRCSHDGVRQRISPNKLPVDALGRDHRGLPPRPACARPRR